MKKIVSLLLVVVISVAVMVGNVAGAEEKLEIHSKYDNASYFVAEMIRGYATYADGSIIYTPESVKMPSEPILHDWVWKRIAECIIEDPTALRTADAWNSWNNLVNGDFLALANWQSYMYEVLLLDWITYQESTEEFESDFTQTTSAFGLKLSSYISDRLGDSMKVTLAEAKKYAEELDYLDQIENFSLAVEALDTVCTTGTEYVETVSKLMALKTVSNSRIAFLEKLTEVSDDKHLVKAASNLIGYYQMSDSQIILNKLGHIMVREGTKQCFNVALDYLKKLSPKAAAIVQTVQLGTAGINWVFNSDETATKTLELTTLYIINVDMMNAYTSLRSDYINNSTEKNASNFIEAYRMYMTYHSYANTIAEKYLAESLLEGLWNKLSNLFDNDKEIAYQNWCEWSVTQQEYVNVMNKVVDCFYKIYAGSENAEYNYSPDSAAGTTPEGKQLSVGDKFTIGYLTYKVISSDEVAVIDCNTSATSVCIPKYINYMGYSYLVTEIGKSSFELCKNLVTVTIPDSVTYIGIWGFSRCFALESIVIPDGVKAIEKLAFYNNPNLKTVIIGNGVTQIGNSAFADTGLTSVHIGNSVTSIGDFAFVNCMDLKSVTIPACVKSIGSYAFGVYEGVGVPKVEGFTINCYKGSAGESYSKRYGGFKCNYLVGQTANLGSNGISSTAVHLIWEKNPSADNYIVCMWDGDVWVELGRTTECNYFVDNLSPCTKYKFSITACVMNGETETTSDPTELEVTTNQTDNNDTPYEYIVYSDYVEINKYTGTEEIVTIPNVLNDRPVKVIGESAFNSISFITSVIIPDSVISIGNNAFDGCKALNAIYIPDGVTSIGNRAFHLCQSLTTITIPESVTSIGDGAFSWCTSLTSVTISNGVTSIGDYAFELCKLLTTFNIPKSVTSIGDSAFANCNSLTSFNVDTANENYSSANGVLFDKEKTVLIAYPAKKSDTSYIIPESVTSICDHAFYFSAALKKIILPDGVTSIGDYAFYNCKALSIINIPDGITSIERSSFGSCSSLTSIILPDSVINIGDYAFDLCTSLTSVSISNSVESIGQFAFRKCSSLTKIDIPESVTNIGDYAFYDCDLLASVNVGDCVTYIGSYVFYDCNSLVSVSIGNGVMSIGDYAFYLCDSLAAVNIPDSVTSISDKAFYGCNSLVSVSIGNGVMSIGDYAFYCCASLTAVNIPDSVTSIGDKAFAGCTSLTEATVPCTWSENPLYDFGENVILTEMHAYTETAIPSTYYEQGYTLHECDNCEYSYKDNYQDKLILPAISDLALKSRNYNSITLSWAENSEASGYIIQQMKDNAWVNVANIRNNAITSYQITNLAANTSYKFRAVAYVTENDKTAYSSYTSALTVSTAPAMTTGFAITGRGSDFLTISWTKNVGASGYVIQEQVNGVWTKVVAIKGNETTSYKVEGLQPNSFHRYRMVAYKTDSNGTCYGKYTGSAPGYTTPAMVGGFKVSNVGADSLTVSWNKVDSANGYVIDIYKDGKWSQLVKIISNETASYKASGLTLGTIYKFRIKSYATNGTLTINSTYSSAISGVPALSAPANLKMTNRGTDFISVRWDKNEAADGYMVYIYDGTKWTCVKTLTNSSSVSHKITGLESGKAYKVAVKAYKMVNGTKYISDNATISATTL